MHIRTSGPAFGAAMTSNERRAGRFLRDGLGIHPNMTPQEIGRAWGAALTDVKSRVEDLEQKGARPAGSGYETKSIGEQFVETDRFTSYRDNRYQGSIRFEAKAVTSVTAGGLIWSQRDTGDAGAMPMRTYRIRDLLTVLRTESGSIDYPKQTTRTNAAAPVAEGNLKPYSDYAWQQVNLPVRTIAHLAKLTRQALDDSTQLAGEVDNEMRYGLALAEDAQLLYGDGLGQNLTGLIVNATAYSAPAGITVTNAQQIDKLGLAIVKLALTEYAPDGIILNPTDWWQIKLLKDAAGGYIGLNPMTGLMGDAQESRLFGLPVAVTTAMNAGTFAVGAFKRQKLYDRMAAEVLISTENADDWERNLATMRCEERLALAVRYPGAIIKGSFA